ncbi:MAG: TIGR03087 family PEP-CTERM/XrtA system glycosyltransferase [Alphaproteobacteria bacterium]
MAKILFLAHRVPYPPDKGEKIRALHMLEHLAERHEVWLGALADGSVSADRLAWLEARCPVVFLPQRLRVEAAQHLAVALLTRAALSVALSENRSLFAWCAKAYETLRPDLVFAFSSAMAAYAVGQTRAPLIVDFVDADSEKFRDYARTRRGPMRLVYAREADRLLAFDRAAARTAKASLFVSQAELEIFAARREEGARSLHVVGNGVDTSRFDPAAFTRTPVEPGLITFTGRMDYHPNVDAVVWFAREIFPRVRDKAANARFRIVGAAPAPAVKALASLPGVEVTGAVEDVRPFYAAAAVSVAPLRIARGVQNKVLEAMAMARPVVVTPAALDGIDAMPGEHLLVADMPAAFADAVVAVLKGSAPPHLAANARARVISHHAWAAHLTHLDAIIDAVLSGALGRDRP